LSLGQLPQCACGSLVRRDGPRQESRVHTLLPSTLCAVPLQRTAQDSSQLLEHDCMPPWLRPHGLRNPTPGPPYRGASLPCEWREVEQSAHRGELRKGRREQQRQPACRHSWTLRDRSIRQALAAELWKQLVRESTQRNRTPLALTRRLRAPSV